MVRYHLPNILHLSENNIYDFSYTIERIEYYDKRTDKEGIKSV